MNCRHMIPVVPYGTQILFHSCADLKVGVTTLVEPTALIKTSKEFKLLGSALHKAPYPEATLGLGYTQGRIGFRLKSI